MKNFLQHLKTYMLRGLLAMIPIALSYLTLRFVYVAIDQNVRRIMDRLLEVDIPGLGIMVTGLTLYVFGLASSNLVGRKILDAVEKVTKRIPLIRTTYQVGKQLSSTLSLPEKDLFKRVVLVDYLKPGIWTIGFVTGTVFDHRHPGEKLLKIFVPTPPNPTSGTMVVARESETRDPGWSVEDALKTVVSGGIIGPGEIK